MKTSRFTLLRNSICITLFFFLISNIALSQVIQVADTTKKAKADTLKTAPAAVTISSPEETQKTDEGKKKDKKGKKNEIILYSGVNFTQLKTSDAYETEPETGYQLGAYYKQGRMFYWQAGARYASAKFGYKPANSPAGTEFGTVQVSEIDLPLTLGVNFTSFMNRVLSVRIFASAVPAFTLKVGDNPYGITKDKVNSFVLYGQGGLGLNVAFLVLESGYNFGTKELLIGNTDSKPGQVFINLGFRF
jgi:hypothetical protein